MELTPESGYPKHSVYPSFLILPDMAGRIGAQLYGWIVIVERMAELKISNIH